jgi:signal transduction histidine kinase
VDEDSYSFHSMRADGGFQVFCFFLFPILHQRDNVWLEVILIVLVLILYTAYFKQFIRLRKAPERQWFVSHSLMELQEKERKRIAAELHESIAQNILVMKNFALIGLRSMRSPAIMARHLTEVSKYTSQTLQDKRKVTQNLRPILLDRLGLTDSLRHLAGTS